MGGRWVGWWGAKYKRREISTTLPTCRGTEPIKIARACTGELRSARGQCKPGRCPLPTGLCECRANAKSAQAASYPASQQRQLLLTREEETHDSRPTAHEPKKCKTQGGDERRGNTEKHDTCYLLHAKTKKKKEG